MKKIKLSYIIYFILGISLIILAISAYKAEKNHEEKLYHALYSKIKENALECYLKQECLGKINLQYLYDLKYLNELVDPVTKEVLDNNLCLEYNNEEVKFC